MKKTVSLLVSECRKKLNLETFYEGREINYNGPPSERRQLKDFSSIILFIFFSYLQAMRPSVGLLIPLFRTSGDICSGFKARVDLLVCNRILRFNLVVNMVTKLFQSVYLHTSIARTQVSHRAWGCFTALNGSLFSTHNAMNYIKEDTS